MYTKIMEFTTNNTTIYGDDNDDKWVFLPIEWNSQTIIRTILAILGTLGNTLVIFVYMNRKRMNSCTNTFIVGLAFADLITSFHQFPRPKEVSVPSGFLGELYCRILFVGSNVTMWISIIASVFTLTMIACERYVAVVYAVHYRTIFSKKRPRYVLLACWAASITLNTQSFYINFLNKDSHTCYVKYPSLHFQKFIGVTFFLIEYFLPMVIMLFTQTRTVMSLRAQARSLTSDRKESNGPALSLLQARRRVIEMLFMVVITFIICWSPDQIAYFCYMMNIFDASFLTGSLYTTFLVLAFANCCMNPFIYASRNANFRRALRELFTKGKKNKVHSINTIAGGKEETMADTLAKQGGQMG
ncbi:galanin receptor 2a-like [Lytechinus pictus]|uniref:galanin receptor 2a-like n=1 Tax=Lytechinus pictus TaxID=7653 RepID=UPI00240DB964|nr:galanin receptor 2a-like [Lytechinus pictus]